jgi:SH3-like domain-containing protein
MPLPPALLLMLVALPIGAGVAQTFPPPPPPVSPASPHAAHPPAHKPRATPHHATPVVSPSRSPHAQKPKPHSAPEAREKTAPRPAHGAAGARPPLSPPAPAKPALQAVAPVVAPAPAPPPSAPPAIDPNKGTVTGQELPRWASLRSDDVNIRVGPGTNFQIDWVYHRRDLPVKIEREYEVWRQVEDLDGVKGWVHQANLTGRRGFVVKDAERVLRASAADDAPAVARLKPGVVGRIRSCAANVDWCEVQVGDYRGFLKREEFWGTFPGEAVN